MRWRSSAALVLAAAALGACAGGGGRGGFRPVSDVPVKIGAPYRAGGRTWVPADERGYDAVGYASWYGASHAGRPTANGERFLPNRISAAHPTLPLPSYVEVTALDSGRTILVRINDRGPFVAGRIIDLSAGAARALGVLGQGVARVRVRRVEPSERDRAALRAGRPARRRPDLSQAALTGSETRPGGRQARVASTGPTPSTGVVVAQGLPHGSARSAWPGEVLEPTAAELRQLYAIPACARPGRGLAGCALYVQVTGFADADLADGATATLRPMGPGQVVADGGTSGVRLGPFVDEAARSALARVRQAGYETARLVGESAAALEPE